MNKLLEQLGLEREPSPKGFVCEDVIHGVPFAVRASWRFPLPIGRNNPFGVRWICNDCKERYDNMSQAEIDELVAQFIVRKLEQA